MAGVGEVLGPWSGFAEGLLPRLGCIASSTQSSTGHDGGYPCERTIGVWDLAVKVLVGGGLVEGEVVVVVLGEGGEGLGQAEGGFVEGVVVVVVLGEGGEGLGQAEGGFVEGVVVVVVVLGEGRKGGLTQGEELGWAEMVEHRRVKYCLMPLVNIGE